MRALRIFILILFVISISAGITPAQAKNQGDLGLEVLPANDGWGSYGAGVTGGSNTAPGNIYTVTNRRELIAARAALDAGKKP